MEDKSLQESVIQNIQVKQEKTEGYLTNLIVPVLRIWNPTWDLRRRPCAAAQMSHTERWSGESLNKSWPHCFHHSEAFKEKESLGLDFPFPKMIFCSSFCCFCRSCSNFIRSSCIFLCSSTIRSWSSACRTEKVELIRSWILTCEQNFGWSLYVHSIAILEWSSFGLSYTGPLLAKWVP